MASPQIENGYTTIANEILDHLYKQPLNGTELKVVMCILRYTFGFRRKSHKLSASFIAKWGSCDVSSVKRALKHLRAMKIVICINDEKRGVTAELKLNKDYEQWKLTGGENATGLVAELPHKKRKKENKNIKTKYYDDFFEKVWKSYPRKMNKSAVTQKAKKELYESGEEVVLKAINSYISEIQENGTAEKYIMYGSIFFNSRWRDYVREPEVQFETKEESEEPVDYSNVEMGW